MFWIIFLLSNGERETILAIYNRLKRRLLYVARSYLQDGGEDAVQDVFCKLSEKYENKMQELCDKPDAFFVSIIRNHAIDLIRKEKGKQKLELDETIIFDESQAPEREILVKDEVSRLQRYLQDLKPIYRELLEYKFFLDYSNTEIAQALDISPSLVSTRLERALAQLRRRFEEEDVQ